MRKYLLSLMLIVLPVASQAKQGVIKLASVEMTDDGYGVVKRYISDDVISVKYSYDEAVLDNGYMNELYLSVIDDLDVHIPVDVLKTGFIVGGDMDNTVRMFKIPQRKIGLNCSFSGEARVTLTDIKIFIPEYPSEYDYSAKVKSVLWASPPVFLCSNND
ncbi:hypothetical protein [Acinetobacter rudis]|uniref:hypothetical protein n=1 Tax=Acinetobacter rudis TaxID=632955 RepID=UPI0033423BA0